jgi:hypothetical protein
MLIMPKASPLEFRRDVIAVVTLATTIVRGIRPRRIRHAWRDIGNPNAWRGHPHD